MSESARNEETRREIQAALGARRELGFEYEEAIAAGLLDRVNQLALMRASEIRREAERVDQVAEAEKASSHPPVRARHHLVGRRDPDHRDQRDIVEPGLLGVAVSWAGIVGVNVAAAINSRRRAVTPRKRRTHPARLTDRPQPRR